jgi:hypothetical protein
MKKLVVLLLCAALATLAAAQNTSEKPSAARLAAAAPANIETPAGAGTITMANPDLSALPAGTAVRMKLETPISTMTSKPGDRFAGRVTEPVLLNGKTVIPVGAALEGRVARASEPRRIRGTPTIDLRPELVVMPDGQRLALNAVVVDTSARPQTEVDDEGRIKGRGRDARDWKETGVATGGGAVVGALVGGGKGTLIGAATGATASIVYWLTKRKSATLPAGTEIIMELSRPMALSSRSAGR